MPSKKSFKIDENGKKKKLIYNKLSYTSQELKESRTFATENELKLPFIIIADIETISVKCENPMKTSKTELIDELHPCGIAYKILCKDPNYYHQPVVFNEEHCMDLFFDSLMADVADIRRILR